MSRNAPTHFSTPTDESKPGAGCLPCDLNPIEETIPSQQSISISRICIFHPSDPTEVL
jgi:hypothetical protein